MKKARQFLKCFILIELGSCFGKSLFQWMHYRNYPKYYALRSAPWYMEILVSVLVTAVVVLLSALAYWLLGRKIKKQEQQIETEAADDL